MARVDKAPRFSAEEAVRFARELYGLDTVASPLPSERDQNFHLRDASGAQFVLKIANQEESHAVLDLQNSLLTFLAAQPTGLEFPRVVPASTGNTIASVTGSDGVKYFVRLLTWVDGICMAQAAPHSAELLRSLGAALARVDSALERFSHPAAHRALHWDLRQAALARTHLDLLPEERRPMVEPIFEAWATIDWSALRSSVIYNDANDYNILVDASGSRVVSLLDFGDVVHSATVCDLAIALAYAMLDKPDPIAAAAEVTGAYHQVRPLTAPEVEALYTLAATRLASSVCYAAWQARQAPGNLYLNISNQPAWALIERLAALPAGWAGEVLRRACGFSKNARNAASLAAARRRTLGGSLSLSYQRPLHIIRGWKQHLYDATGRAYLDCVNNVAHVGHSHPHVVEAAARQMALLNTNTRYLHEHLTGYIERLTATLPEPLRVAFLVTSGSEANELALRLARAHTGGNQVVVVDVAYHGNTNALVEISPYKFNGPGGRGKPAHVRIAPMPDVYRGPHRGPDAGARYAQSVADAARQAAGPATFFCESALGCGGQIILPPGYMKEAFAAVRASGGVTIADEVQTGFGRAGSHFWMFETQDVVPDIVTMGKPIGNGHPMGAVVTTAEIAASFGNGMEYFNTFGGNPVSCAVGLAVLDVIRDEALQQNALSTGNYLLAGLRELAARHPIIGDVRGLGLFLGFELVRDRATQSPAAAEASALVDRMKDLGVLLSTDGPFHNVIKIKPPMVFSPADAGTLLDRLDAALR
ncbi:MAG: aminotransferase class III-fold pyridoxal phosphate-dependent enzyme [Bryobacteraceae bacterium]|jgi:4-aminobutyrate aminotransferase-like enzyme